MNDPGPNRGMYKLVLVAEIRAESLAAALNKLYLYRKAAAGREAAEDVTIFRAIPDDLRGALDASGGELFRP